MMRCDCCGSRELLADYCVVVDRVVGGAGSPTESVCERLVVCALCQSEALRVFLRSFDTGRNRRFLDITKSLAIQKGKK